MTSCSRVFSLRIFYHQGECLQIYLRQGTPETDAEEIIAEIVARLSAVTGGAETQVRTLKGRGMTEEFRIVRGRK